MAELLGLVGSIIAVGQLTTTVVNYLDGALNASEEVKSLREELTNISRILDQLQERAKLFEVLKIPFPTIQTLLGSGGPLEQFQKILTVFESRLGQDKKGFKQVYKMMGWPLRKEEVRDILASLERYKMLFIFALNNDQM
jgi:hypothetical protein